MSAEEARALRTSRRPVALLDSAPSLCSCFDMKRMQEGVRPAVKPKDTFFALYFKGYVRFVVKCFTVERDY